LDWIKLTYDDGRAAHLNISEFCEMSRTQNAERQGNPVGEPFTRLFTGTISVSNQNHGAYYTDVTQTPEEILSLLKPEKE